MKKNFQKQKGFTLIELLVVVALIAILAGVILASTSASRAKGANAGIKTNLRTVMQQAELVYIDTSPNGYGTVAFASGLCAQTAGTLFNNMVIWSAILETRRQSGGTMPTCASTSSVYAVSAPLKAPEGSNLFWCIDSQGSAKGKVGNITGPACN